MNEQSTPDGPTYAKQKHEAPSAKGQWFIKVDEGWSSWILCERMYEWAADELLARLRENNRRWPHA